MRIALVPAFVLVAGGCSDELDRLASCRIAAFALLIALSVSDVLDGWIARRFDLATPLGAVLDAFSDKLAQVALLGFFAFQDGQAYARVPIWFFALVFVRDLALGVGWLVVRARRGRVEVVHERHGKLASFAVFALLIWLAAGGGQAVVDAAAIAIACVVAISPQDYVRAGWRQLRASTG